MRMYDRINLITTYTTSNGVEYSFIPDSIEVKDLDGYVKFSVSVFLSPESVHYMNITYDCLFEQKYVAVNSYKLDPRFIDYMIAKHGVFMDALPISDTDFILDLLVRFAEYLNRYSLQSIKKAVENSRK